MSTGERQLFPHFPTHYLKMLGEMLLCSIALQTLLDAGGREGESWRERADELVDESVRIGEAVSRAKGCRAVFVELQDGSTVVADADYLNRLVRKMHRHHSLGLVQMADTQKELIAS